LIAVGTAGLVLLRPGDSICPRPRLPQNGIKRSGECVAVWSSRAGAAKKDERGCRLSGQLSKPARSPGLAQMGDARGGQSFNLAPPSACFSASQPTSRLFLSA